MALSVKPTVVPVSLSLSTRTSQSLHARPSSNHALARSSRLVVKAGVASSGSTVLVIGATGGVGQLACAKLLERGYKVKALCRDPEKAASVLKSDDKNLELVVGDCRDAASLKDVAKGADAVICVTGTTAFPSARWKNGNGPKNTDYVGPLNVFKEVQASAPDLKRFIFVTSVGVQRTKVMPFMILNAFKVLEYKRMAEEYLESSGLPYTIMRPGRLTDGPYTSYDLNTLLQATSGSKRAVELAQGETLLPEATSRIVLAEACIQALGLMSTENQAYELASTEGPGPDEDASMWEKLFAEV